MDMVITFALWSAQISQCWSLIVIFCMSLKTKKLNNHSCWQIHMWQSRAEIEGYSVMYANHITVFEVLYR